MEDVYHSTKGLIFLITKPFHSHMKVIASQATEPKTGALFIFKIAFISLATLCSMQDLSSLISSGTRVLCMGSSESQPLDQEESPKLEV